jgi:hypothetical protein
MATRYEPVEDFAPTHGTAAESPGNPEQRTGKADPT